MHPYQKYIDTPIWNIISNALDSLEKNQDIEIKTEHSYVTGYITKIIIEYIKEEKIKA